MATTERFDVAVIGAGVMGTATARSLGERGVRTVLLERFAIGHARGSSHGAVRIFRLSYLDAMYVRMAQQALPLWRRLEEDAGERLVVTTGGIDAGPVADDCARALQEAGARFDWLPADEAAGRFPAISFEGFERVLHQPDGGVCLADRTVAAQARLAAASGVDVRTERTVHRIAPGTASWGGVVVETSDGEVEAGVAVVTAGPWAASLLSEHLGLPTVPDGARGPLQATLQQVYHFEPRDPEAVETMPTFVEWIGPAIVHYAVPPVGEAPGVKVGDHLVGPPIDPSDGPFSKDASGLPAVAAYAANRFPGVDATKPLALETCVYTMTPDEDFVLDRVGDVVIGAGFSGHGFKFAPLIGEILADLATGVEPRTPLGRFAAARL